MNRIDLELSRTFADVAQRLSVHHDLDGVLRSACVLAVRVVDGCEEAGVSLLHRRRVRTHGATGPLPEVVDRAQYDTGQGPCLDVIRAADIIVVEDLATDGRWPAFTIAADGTGVRSMLAYCLHADGRVVGALNLYARKPGAFASEAAVDVGAVFAAHVAAAVLAADRNANLAEALATRSTISMAVGLLMGRQHVTEEQAFDMLKRASQRTNVKLRDVARQLTDRAADPRG